MGSISARAVFTALVILAVATLSALAELGVDVSTAVSREELQCLQQQNVSFVIPRCYCSVGAIDPACAATATTAAELGMKVDVYFFPGTSPDVKLAPIEQVRSFVDYVTHNRVAFDTVWVDVEPCTQCWDGSDTTNARTVLEFALLLESFGFQVGIYASDWAWTQVCGSEPGFPNYPLWYPHYDNNQTFDDFEPFAGWTKPVLKQYAPTLDMCGASVDLDWRP